MSPSPKESRARASLWLRALVGVLLLNAAVTFHNVWPTLGVHWPGELSVELAALLLLLALSNAWLGPTAPRVLAWLSALVVLFALGRYGEVTAPALYGREINLYWDGPRLVSVVQMFVRVASAWQVLAVCGGALLALTLLYLLARWSLRQIDAPLHRYHGARLGLGLVSALLLAAFLVQQLSDRLPRLPRFSIPVSRTYGQQIAHIVDALSSSRARRVLPPSPPLRSDLQALSGSDVLLVFLESYGSVTYDRPDYARALQPARARLAAALKDTGRSVASAFVTSPTFGGQSVLAHLSLLSGIAVRDSTRYALLMTQKRPTLVSTFKAAGYRAVAVMPGMRQDWPEGAFYGFDDIYDSAKLRYHGPEFGWWRIPDQYTVAALDARELQRHPRKPLFVFFPTVSTHIPFQPVPPLQSDWQRVLSDQPYDVAPLRHALAQHADWADMGTSYLSAVEYSFDVLASYLRARASEDFVLIVLGDHQPAAIVSGEGAPWDVPVHIISKRTDILQTLQRRGFRSDLMPVRPAVGEMNELAVWLLDAFDRGHGS
ncbi:MAG TPA: sulfatase-like hydrolase/transferase [Steroidobacteraceae bacterium]|nr:sulfatase-like hydrolase/transferase [Steroidobacteraceae bacterium]